MSLIKFIVIVFLSMNAGGYVVSNADTDKPGPSLFSLILQLALIFSIWRWL